MKPAALAAVAIVVLTATPVRAAGLGATPDVVDIESTRGGVHESTVIVFGDEEPGTVAFVQVTGDIDDWIAIAPALGDPQEPIRFGPGGRAVFLVIVEVPEDAANGVYGAQIQVVAENDGASISPSIVIPAIVDVSGDAVVSGEAAIVTPTVAAAGEPINAAVGVTNTGTVRSTPTVRYTLTDAGGSESRGSVTGTEIAPEQSNDIRIAMEHEARAGETLTVTVDVELDGIVIGSDRSSISIVDPSALDAGIEAGPLVVAEPAERGGIASLAATFTNPAATDAATRFVGTVSVDGVARSTIESITLTAAPGQTATLDLFVPIDTEGSYEVVGRWDGQADGTADVSVSWTVGGALPAGPIIAALVVVVVVGTVLLVWYGGGRHAEPGNEAKRKAMVDDRS